MENKKNHTSEITTHEMKIRQERYEVGLDNLKIRHDEATYQITNYSLFGIAFEAKHNFEISSTIDVELFFDDMKICEFSLDIKRKHLDEKKQFEYGAELVGSIFPVDEVFQIFNSRKILNNVEERYSRYKNINFSVKNYVDDLYIWLDELEGQVKKFANHEYETANKKKIAEACVVDIIGKAIEVKLKHNNNNLAALIANSKFEENKIIFEYYRYRLGKFIFQSPFTMRSFSKPKGYAGDYEMMNIIYRSDNFASSLFGSCMEKAVSLHEEPLAVRNRVNFLSQKIMTSIVGRKQIKILSVACGPSEEVKDLVGKLNQDELDKIELTLLDQDEDALRYAQNNIRQILLNTGKRLQFNLTKKNIKDIIIEGLDSNYDLIYSAGLFDYFTDAVARRAARSLFASLNAGGTLLIGNFNTEAPNTFGMLALFDWYLILRSREDLLRIFSFDGSKCLIEAEPKNVNLFCEINKN